MGLLAEIHDTPNLKTQLMFEVELLCKKIDLTVGEIKRLKVHSKRVKMKVHSKRVKMKVHSKRVKMNVHSKRVKTKLHSKRVIIV